MKKLSAVFSILMFLLICLSGCNGVVEKSASLSVVYAIMAVLSLLPLIGYCFFIKKKDPWFFVLFSGVLVVNIGYFCLSVSSSLEEALLANRISYLGSVILPLSMLLIILRATGIRYKKFIPVCLIILASIIFFIAASPGYSTIYYKSAELVFINGVAVLQKQYGPLHILYLFYLFGYFAAMIVAVIQATIKKRMEGALQTFFLIASVFVNIGIWLIEQFVKIDFEFLSVSYFISELFLIGLYLLMEHDERFKSPSPLPEAENSENSMNLTSNDENETPVKTEYDLQGFKTGLTHLTPTEMAIYRLYIEGKSTKEVIAALNITENTLKYHNKNIYGKLGVPSRKKLMEIAAILNNK